MTDADEHYRSLGPQQDTRQQREERAAWYRGYGLALLGALSVVVVVLVIALVGTFV